MVGPTLSNEIFKSDNPTEPPSHEPSFHSVISSLPRSGYPGGRGKYRVRRAPIDRPNRIKGNIEDFANLSLLAILPEMFLSQQARDVHMDLLFLLLFSQRREKGVERWGAFVHWKSLLRLSTVDTIGMVFGAYFFILSDGVRCSIRCYLLFVVFGEIFGFFLKFVHRVSLLYL